MSEARALRNVFISFAQEDRLLADRVADRLRSENISVWNFSDQTQSGKWHLNELKALRESRVAVFLLTENSENSSACRDEAERAADPTQQNTVPVPLVVGNWDYAASDLWLMLGKWNGVVAEAGLDETSLGRLVGLVHDRLGMRPVSSLSTGQALVAVKDGLREFIGRQSEMNEDLIRAAARELQQKLRGTMVSFLQFAHLEREFASAQLLTSASAQLKYINEYLEAYFVQVVATSYERCSERLARQIKPDDTIAITEYSRIITHAMQHLASESPDVFASLKFLIVSRQGLLLVDDEPLRMRNEIVELGATPICIDYTAWVELVLGRRKDPRFSTVDKVLFGVEAFSRDGDVAFPQVVKEVDQLRTRRRIPGPLAAATIIAAGDSYKICSDSTEVARMSVDPHYTVIDHTVFDIVVTDLGEYTPNEDGSFDLHLGISAVDAMCDEIRLSLWPKGHPLPIWNLPNSARVGATLVACDIDDTITADGKIPLRTIEAFTRLNEVGIATLLVTGRSAGWASALAHYLPVIKGVIAENGAIFIDSASRDSSPSLVDGWDANTLSAVKQRISACVDEVRLAYPAIVSSTDNFTRLTDFAFEVAEGIDPELVAEIARRHQLGHTYSSVHHHIRGSLLDKETGLLRVLVNKLGFEPDEVASRVLTVGDGFNDKPLFTPGRFVATVGVRNVLSSLEVLGENCPGFVTLRRASEGFDELASLLCSGRNPVIQGATSGQGN
jgi:HAD superfamily hydrolase (TIGR01484 family)